MDNDITKPTIHQHRILVQYVKGQHSTVIWRRDDEAFAQPRDTTAA